MRRNLLAVTELVILITLLDGLKALLFPILLIIMFVRVCLTMNFFSIDFNKQYLISSELIYRSLKLVRKRLEKVINIGRRER